MPEECSSKSNTNTSRNCYCNERKINPALRESMKDIPVGYCGICDVCGKPGHMSAHPYLATSGCWCDEHWAELNSIRSFNLPQLVFSIISVVILLAAIFIFRHMLAEVPLSAYSIFFKDNCTEIHFDGKSPTAIAIKNQIESKCSLRSQESKDRKESVSINLSETTKFSWDKLYVIQPYQPKLAVVMKVGLNGDLLACSKSAYYDEWTQLVFVSKGEVSSFFDIPTFGLLNFDRKYEYKADEALFLVSCPESPQ